MTLDNAVLILSCYRLVYSVVKSYVYIFFANSTCLRQSDIKALFSILSHKVSRETNGLMKQFEHDKSQGKFRLGNNSILGSFLTPLEISKLKSSFTNSRIMRQISPVLWSTFMH